MKTAVAGLGTLVVLGLLPAVALASSEAHNGGGGPSPEQWMLLVLAAINFTIFVFLIRRFVARPLGDYLVGRRKEVVEALAAAAREKAEAEKVKADYEAKAAGLEDLRHSMIEEMRGIAKADRKRGLVEARQAAERIAADAERTAVSDVEMAKRELRREAARLAAKLATERIRADLDEDKKDKLFAEFIAGVER